MLQILLGTRNKHKQREIRNILRKVPVRWLDLNKFKAPRIKEDGKSYRANALKKARGFARATGQIVLAEDSGLEVKRLAGKPGIYSARYSCPNKMRAGPGATARSNNLKLLKALQGVAHAQRQAQYKCVVVLAAPRKILAITEGICRGYIADRLKGRQGFGYDPLFVVPKYNKTFGQLPNSVKNRISHRAKALLKLKTRLLKMSNELRYF